MLYLCDLLNDCISRLCLEILLSVVNKSNTDTVLKTVSQVFTCALVTYVKTGYRSVNVNM